jgi:hypothetical protein
MCGRTNLEHALVDTHPPHQMCLPRPSLHPPRTPREGAAEVGHIACCRAYRRCPKMLLTRIAMPIRRICEMSRVSMRPGHKSRRTCAFGPRNTALGQEHRGAAPLLARPRNPQPNVPLPTRRALGQESRGAAPLSVRPPKPQPIVPLPTRRACVVCVCVRAQFMQV